MNTNNIHIQFIYTFKSINQIMLTIPGALKVLENKNTLFNFATAELTESEKKELVKISSCVILDDSVNITPPDWYMKCKGKLFI